MTEGTTPDGGTITTYSAQLRVEWLIQTLLDQGVITQDQANEVQTIEALPADAVALPPTMTANPQKAIT